MGSCCSHQENDPNKTIDKVTTNEPLVKKSSNEPDFKKADHDDIVFPKIDLISSSSDNIDKDELNEMMKTDDDGNDDDIEDDAIDNEVEEEEDVDEDNKKDI